MTDKIKVIKKLKSKQNIQNEFFQDKYNLTNENNNNANDTPTKNVTSHSNRAQKKNINLLSKNIAKMNSYKKIKDPIKIQDFILDEKDLMRTREH